VSSPTRRLLALIALVALLLVGSRLVGVIGAGPVPITIHYRLGAAPATAALEVVFRTKPGEPPVARFETQLIGPDVVESTRLPAGAVDLDITLVTPDGARRTLGRTIEAVRDAVITIDLQREAAAWR
jgi:hypothetical protein